MAAGDEFLGHYRKQAKTSIVRTSTQIARATAYTSLTQLLDALPPDAHMRSKYPKLLIQPSASPTQKLAISGSRVPEERHNVRVDCWLYHVRLEGDDDYHTIVGSSASAATARFLNAEVSGLPPGGKDLTVLRRARSQLQTVARTPIPKTTYLSMSPPRRVRVTGSLFFDADHFAGTIGPKPHNPQTVWEIHPVISIETR